MFETIKSLTGAFGVSGNEEEIRETIISMIKDKVDEIKVDAMGNLFAIKKGNGKKILLAAHMDEIGVIVTHIDEKGFLRFSNVGAVSAFVSYGQRVKFKNGTIGIIGKEEKLEEIKNLKLGNLFIDIGAHSREEAEKLVKIGEVANFVGETFLQGDMVVSKALDDRAACAVLIETIKNLPKTDNEIYFVFTTQEELGLRGAKTAAYQVEADLAIAVDVTGTGDTPEAKLLEVAVGKGPAVKIKDHSVMCHKDVVDLIKNKAEENNIPYQIEILEYGGTDAGAIHISGGGIPTGAISIPTRFIHSPSEYASLNDIENCAKLLTFCIIK